MELKPKQMTAENYVELYGPKFKKGDPVSLSLQGMHLSGKIEEYVGYQEDGEHFYKVDNFPFIHPESTLSPLEEKINQCDAILSEIGVKSVIISSCFNGNGSDLFEDRLHYEVDNLLKSIENQDEKQARQNAILVGALAVSFLIDYCGPKDSD